MNKSSLIIFTFLALSVCSYSANVTETRKWEVLEIEFHSTEKIDKPFDVDLKCLFMNNSLETLSVPGFYNGGNQWVVRFTPPKTGTWRYISSSSIEEMNGLTGTLEVEEAVKGNHGSIKISETNSAALSYEDGTPYHLIAYEADWLFAPDYGNAEIPKTKRLINLIAEMGFNQVIMNVYAYDAPWSKDPDLSPAYDYSERLDIFPFGGTNENPDYSTLNIDFFKHLDRLIEHLNEKDVISHLMIYVWNKGVNWPEAESEGDNLYFDYVAKRYQAYPNLIWDISKEALGYGHDDMDYITRRIERLRKLDGYNRLLTVHDYSYCSEFPEKVDIISVQTWVTSLYAKMMDIRERFPQKPILNIEHGGYEKSPYIVFKGAYNEPEALLKRNYHCAFAGSYSTYYWQGTSWYVVIHNPFAEAMAPHPKFIYYRYFSDFLDRINFNELAPSPENTSSGFCLSDKQKGLYVYYIPEDNYTIFAKNLKESDKISLTWFNPFTGQFSEEENLDWSRTIRIENKNNGLDNIAILKMIK